MKILKLFVCMLLFAILFDFALVFAYPSPIGTVYSFELNGNTSQYTSWRTKTNYNRQTYENISAFTVLTNPCPACQILSKPLNEDGTSYTGRVTTSGITTSLDNNASVPGNYRVLVKRNDITLLTTYHSSFWTMN